AVESLLARRVEGARGAWVVGIVPPAEPDALREAADRIRAGLKRGAAALAAVGDGKGSWLAVVTEGVAQAAHLTAADILKAGGIRGGGRPTLAQGGGKDPELVPEQLRKMAEFLASRLETAMLETWTA